MKKSIIILCAVLAGAMICGCHHKSHRHHDSHNKPVVVVEPQHRLRPYNPPNAKPQPPKHVKPSPRHNPPVPVKHKHR